MERALSVREEINDFIDCLLLSSAAARTDALVTEDEELQRVGSQESIRAKLRRVPPSLCAVSGASRGLCSDLTSL